MSFDLEDFKYTKSALQNSGWFDGADLSDILVSDVRYTKAEVYELLLGVTTNDTEDVIPNDDIADSLEASVSEPKTRRRRPTTSTDLL